MFDATTKSVQPIAGTVNLSTRQVAWNVGQNGSMAFESTLDELLKPAPAVTVVTAAGRQPGTLVLLPAPASAAPAGNPPRN